MKPKVLLFDSKLCGTCMKMCRHVCPTGQLVLKSEGSLPWSRGLVAFATLSKFINWSKSAVDTLYQCATCKHCYVWCRPEVELDLIVEEMRSVAIKECPDCIPAGVMNLSGAVSRTKNVLDEPAETRMNKIDASLIKSTPGAKVGFFIGCVTAYRTPEIANAVLRVLNAQGIDYQVIGNDEMCCGGPLVRAGHKDQATQLATENVEQFKAKGIETLIMSCPGCLHAFAIDYPKEFKIKETPRALHVIDFLRENGWKPSVELKEKITFHDPCHYARHLKDDSKYDVPRAVIKEMGGDLREMTWHREHAQCCGAGGSLRVSFPEIAAKIGELRINEAVETGAKYLLSTCPLCKQHLAEAAKKVPAASHLEVKDLMELL
jgi:Fe-S oxidoreductase